MTINDIQPRRLGLMLCALLEREYKGITSAIVRSPLSLRYFILAIFKSYFQRNFTLDYIKFRSRKTRLKTKEVAQNLHQNERISLKTVKFCPFNKTLRLSFSFRNLSAWLD